MSTIDTSGFARDSRGLVFPSTSSEVTWVLEKARRYGVPVHAVSTGMNAGRSDWLPPSGDCVVLHLGTMRKILDYNEREGWLRVEPGVTQEQAANYLSRKHSALEIFPTSWLKESSLLGNSLDRGHTLLGLREPELVGATVALPSGELLRTGFDPTAPSPVAGGLSLHALLFQSNLGIVVEGVFRLQPRRRERYYLIPARRPEALPLGQYGARALRWFCSQSLLHSPLVGRKLRAKQGALMVMVPAANTRAFLRDHRAARGAVLLNRDQLYVAAHSELISASVALFSFTARLSPKQLSRAVSTVERCRRLVGKLSFTVSFPEAPFALFVLRAEGAKRPHSFLRIEKILQRAGYRHFRSHAALAFTPPIPRLGLGIKAVFDPEGIVSPGRYGL